jgi:capsular polysaccharide export protein
VEAFETPVTNLALLKLAHARRVLMLQGPIGPFFQDMACCLTSAGREVLKVNFNGGDLRYFPAGRAYRGSLENWPAELQKMIMDFRPDACVLFGQDRPIHKTVRQVLASNRLPALVFEEGYVRPQFVTFEVGGVNALSSFGWTPPEAAGRAVAAGSLSACHGASCLRQRRPRCVSAL